MYTGVALPVPESAVKAYMLSFAESKMQFSPELADWSRKFLVELKDQEVNNGLFQAEISQKNVVDFEKKKSRLREMLAEQQVTHEEYKSDLKALEEKYKPTTKTSSVDWFAEANKIVDLTEELYTVLDKGTVQAKRSILSRLGSNLVWNDKELNINNTKPIDALIKGISLAQQTNPKFEPKNCVVYKGSKEKTAEFSTVFSTMLPRTGKFGTP